MYILKNAILILLLVFMGQIKITKCQESRWLYRTDGNGVNIHINDSIKLIILPTNTGKSRKMQSNAEVYNNPCCLEYFSKCSNYESIIFPLPYETQICNILNDICKHSPSISNECNLQKPKNSLDRYITNPIQDLKDSYVNVPYLYGIFNITIDTSEEKKYKNGTFGFGLWNTASLPKDMELAWFMYFQNSNNTGLYIMICGNMSCKYKKMDFFTGKNKYDIVWSDKYFEFYVNDKSVYKTNKTIHKHMAYHTWIDNLGYDVILNKDGKIKTFVSYFQRFFSIKSIGMSNFKYKQF